MDNAFHGDKKALYSLGYGLYVATLRDGARDSGLVVNTVCQVAGDPLRIGVCIQKANYSYELLCRSGSMNVNCLAQDAPFSLIERFGFHSGRDTDKFAGLSCERSENGLAVLPEHITAVLSLRVEQTLDLGSHGMFLCSVTEGQVRSAGESMSYAYYQKNVKPRPQTPKKKGYVCTVCGYVYEGDTLPPDFICPLCKHGAEAFVPIE